jgi:hypothetical protein
MKCKKCGHTAKTIGAMAAHYRKAHPGAMKPKGRRVKSKSSEAPYDLYMTIRTWPKEDLLTLKHLIEGILRY